MHIASHCKRSNPIKSEAPLCCGRAKTPHIVKKEAARRDDVVTDVRFQPSRLVGR